MAEVKGVGEGKVGRVRIHAPSFVTFTFVASVRSPRANRRATASGNVVSKTSYRSRAIYLSARINGRIRRSRIKLATNAVGAITTAVVVARKIRARRTASAVGPRTNRPRTTSPLSIRNLLLVPRYRTCLKHDQIAVPRPRQLSNPSNVGIIDDFVPDLYVPGTTRSPLTIRLRITIAVQPVLLKFEMTRTCGLQYSSTFYKIYSYSVELRLCRVST